MSFKKKHTWNPREAKIAAQRAAERRSQNRIARIEAGMRELEAELAADEEVLTRAQQSESLHAR